MSYPLMQRESSGVRVELFHEDYTHVEVTVNEISRSTIVPDAEALEAFWHPMIYLSPEAVAELFPRHVPEDDEGIHIDLSDADPDAGFEYEEDMA